MNNNINIKISSMFAVVLVILISLTPKYMLSQSETCNSRYGVVEPTLQMEAVLKRVCSSADSCLYSRSEIPFFGRVMKFDSLLTVRIEQATCFKPSATHVCLYENVVFFILYKDINPSFFHETGDTLCTDTLPFSRTWNGNVIKSYSDVIADDYYEAKFTFLNDRFQLCCEHSCIKNQQDVPNLKPQNIHYSPRSLDRLYIYSPYVDTVSIATVRLSIKFDNIRRMNVVDIKDLTYLWVCKYQTDRYPDKEYFYYDGCEIADPAQFAYYKSQIEDVIHKLRFRVPRRYKRFPKFKQKYGYDDYLITDFRISECEPVVLTLKVLPAFMK